MALALGPQGGAAGGPSAASSSGEKRGMGISEQLGPRTCASDGCATPSVSSGATNGRTSGSRTRRERARTHLTMFSSSPWVVETSTLSDELLSMRRPSIVSVNLCASSWAVKLTKAYPLDLCVRKQRGR